MRDLEIRGAGNLLGAAQSGFIGAVGFETYCATARRSDRRTQGRAAALDEDRREAVIDVKLDAFIPNDYIPQVSQKIAVYQQLAKARTQGEVEEIARRRARPLRPASRSRSSDLVEITKLRAIALARRRDARGRRRAAPDARRRQRLRTRSRPRSPSCSRSPRTVSASARARSSSICPAIPAGKDSEAVWMPLLRKLLEAL